MLLIIASAEQLEDKFYGRSISLSVSCYLNVSVGECFCKDNCKCIYSMFHKTGGTGISELECMSQNILSIYSNKQSFRVKDQILQREECELL